VLLAQAVERLRGVAEALVGEQLSHQIEPRIGAIESGERLGRVGAVAALLARRERLRLDLDQRRREHEELPRRLHVDPMEFPEMLEVLLGDLVDRDVVDVDLGPPDQDEEQVERPLELLEPDEVFALPIGCPPGRGGRRGGRLGRGGFGGHGRSVGHAGRLAGERADDRRR
jgi:hypothetical protein